MLGGGGGGSHCIQLLGLEQKVFQESGLEGVFIESVLYGSSSAMALLQGKSYIKGIKGHKLIMEVLLHLKWDAFCSWVSKGGGGGVESEGGSILNLANHVIERYRTATRAEEKKEAYLLLCNTATYVEGLLTRFKQEIVIETFQVTRQVHRDDSPSSRVDLSRTRGDWELHLKVTTKMIPYFFAMDRLNYTPDGCQCIIIMDMRHLQKKL